MQRLQRQGFGRADPVPFTDSSPVTQVAAGGSLAPNGSLFVGLADGTFWACGSDTFRSAR